MLNIKIIATGDVKEAYWQNAIKEYQKRLGAWCKIEEIILKEERLPDNPTQSQIDKALECEEKRILEKISSKSLLVIISITCGLSYSSSNILLFLIAAIASSE